MRIKLHMKPNDAIVVMSDGNPGAINVMCALIKKNPADGFFNICRLDAEEIYGSNIWFALKYMCELDLKTFITKLKNGELTKEKVAEARKKNG